jgi:hypothetical protein
MVIFPFVYGYFSFGMTTHYSLTVLTTQVTVKVFLQPIDQDQEEYLSAYIFYLAVNSSNPEKDYDLKVNMIYNFFEIYKFYYQMILSRITILKSVFQSQ